MVVRVRESAAGNASSCEQSFPHRAIESARVWLKSARENWEAPEVDGKAPVFDWEAPVFYSSVPVFDREGKCLGV
jgi:hypothetical protein